MKCEDALLLIGGHLDHANTPQEEHDLQDHLHGCENCREILRSFTQIDEDVASLREKAPCDLRRNVMAQIGKETKKKRYRPWFTVAVAAVMVLAIGVSAMVELPEELDEPQTASASETYTMSRTVHTVDLETLAETLAEEHGAAVVVIHELLYEIETYPCQTLEEGYLLYALPDGGLAVELGERYGCHVCQPDGASQSDVSYALLAP